MIGLTLTSRLIGPLRMDWLYLAPFCRTETVNQDAWQLNGRIGPLYARYILVVYADRIVTNAIHNEQVRDIMLQVDRADYCQHDPYSDFPQELGHNATISAPHMHAYALEHSLSVLTPGARRILDVGSGSGYLATCYAELDSEYLVVGVDHIPELVEQALANTSRHHKDLLESGRVRYVVGDGREGYPELAPYDVIHVGAAAAGRPARLLSQLKAGGVLIAPVGVRETEQQIVIYRKDGEGNVSEQATLSVRYVPLTDRKTQEQL